MAGRKLQSIRRQKRTRAECVSCNLHYISIAFRNFDRTDTNRVLHSNFFPISTAIISTLHDHVDIIV